MVKRKRPQLPTAGPSSGELIVYYRKERGLLAKELALSMGIPESVLSDYETGKRVVTEKTRVRAAPYLDIDPDDLIDGTPTRDQTFRSIIDLLGKKTPEERQKVLADMIRRL